MRFALLESTTVVAAILIGRIGHQLAMSLTQLVVPDVDAAILFFGCNELMMPVGIVAYLGLLRYRARQGCRFIVPPTPRDGNHQRQWTTFQMFGATLLAGGALLLLTTAITLHWFLPQILPAVNERGIILESSLDDQWPLTISVGLVGPVSEELLFRGLLFARCVSFMGVLPAVVLSSILFGVGHGSASPGATVMGGAFAGMYLVTGSLLPPALLHVLHNSSLFINSRAFSPMVSSTAGARAHLPASVSSQIQFSSSHSALHSNTVSLLESA